MGSDAGAAPATPDATKTAAAQTNADVQTAIANAALSNPNVSTALGTSTYAQTGTQTITDESGNKIEVPTYTNTQTLSPTQQALYDQQTSLGSKMNNTALSLADSSSGMLGSTIDASKLPQVQSSYGAQNTFDQGAPIKTSFDSGGQIQTGVSGVGPLQYYAGQANQFGPAGAIQTSVGPQDFSSDRQAVTDALLSRLNPQIDLDRNRLEQKLANQGISMGTDAWKTGTDALNRQVNDQRMQAVLAGGQEQSRLAGLQLNQANYGLGAQGQQYNQAQGRGLFANNANAANAAFYNQAKAQQFGQNVSQGNFANAAQAQQFGQNQSAADFNNSAAAQQYAQNQGAANFYNTANSNAATFNNSAAQQALQTQMSLRDQAINEMNALQSGGQVTMPTFASYNAPTIASSTLASDTYNSAAADTSKYNTASQKAASDNAGMYSLGAATIGAAGKAATSDRRLKEGIVPLGIALPNGLPLYRYTYKLDVNRTPQVGVMADEVETILPDAVVTIGGFKHVYYSEVVR